MFFTMHAFLRNCTSKMMIKIKIKINIKKNINRETQTEEINYENKSIPKEWRTIKDHPIQNIIGDISKGVKTQCSYNKICNQVIEAHWVFRNNLDESFDK